MEKWQSLISSEELKRKYNIFMNRYGSKFTYTMKNEMDNYFVKRVGKYDNPTDFFQLYDHFGALPDENNFYLYHMNAIKDSFNINSNILEIGGGTYPSFARRIASEQLKLGIGTITVYDPRLVTTRCTKYKNLKLYKKKFNSNIDITDYDLLVGIMPCEATEIMIDTIDKYKKDFYIAFCGCGKSVMGRFFYRFFVPDYDLQIQQLKYICEQNDLGELIVDYLPDKYNVEHPIVYNKRKTF